MVARNPLPTQTAARLLAPAVPEAFSPPWSGRIRRGKIDLPELPASAVARPRVVKLIDEGAYPLTLIVAPAGFGKTIAAVDWARSAPGAVWLTADAGDVSLPRLWAHLHQALGAMSPHAGELVSAAMARPGRASALEIGHLLADELLDVGPLRLIIDDVHLIGAGEPHDFLTGLLEIPPPKMRLVMTSRTDPPLALPRMRIRGVMNEVRITDLLFTEEEVRSLVAIAEPSGGHPVSDARVRELRARTGGWAAGLRLAAKAPRRVIPGESANPIRDELDAPLLSVLLEETLEGLSLERQAILLRAALPDRFDERLMAVLVKDDVAPEAITAAVRFALAADLCRRTPPDEPGEPGEGYAFHAVFRAVLRHRLEASLPAADVRSLHRAAARWFEAQGAFGAAIDHWVAAGEHELAALLVECQIHPLLAREDWPTLSRWMRRLPEALVRERPKLLMARAWLAHARGRFALKRECARAAEQLLENGGGDGIEIAALRAELDVLRLEHSGVVQNNPSNAATIARRALANLSPDQRFPIGLAWMSLGMALACLGRAAESEATLTNPVRQLSDRVDAGSIRGVFGRCVVALQSGALTTVEAHARTMIDLATGHGLRLTAGWGGAFAGDALYELGDNEGTIRRNTIVALDYEHCHFVSVIEAMFTLAQAYLASGRPADATGAMHRLHEIVVRSDATEQLSLLHACDAYLALLMGDVEAAARWAQSARPLPADASLYSNLSPAVIRATILCTAGGDTEQEEAAQILTELRARAERAYFVRPLVRIDGLRAVLAMKRGNRAAALEAMRQALAIGVPRGYRRTYLDLMTLFPREMASLLPDLDAPPALRAALKGERRDVKEAGGLPESSPVTDLTRREIEILTALDRRLSYDEIAAELFISPHTVKRHACNVYSKLGVSGRAAALTAARAMGWRPGEAGAAPA